ncbi:MAG: DUF6364 family protein [Verrucomicrobia bacterium]|nr:DUF6364 family protein [Verrucomicrobiota bacterium]MDA1066831.1 DUF6364 family protein [Verrucomicrobiota bacterium]
MKSRVTITLDPKIHERAKRLARRRRASVSGLIESLLSEQQEPDGSIVDSMIGSSTLKPSKSGDTKQEALQKKYLR